MKKIGWAGLMFCMLTACSFDQDEAFYPITQAAYFLTIDTLSGQKYIACLKGNELSADWNRQIGINAPGDMAGRGSDLWVADPAIHRVFQLDLPVNQIAKTFETGLLSPHSIAIGTDYLLISDSLRFSLGFLRLRDGKIFERKLIAPPGQASYRSGRFYVSHGNREVLAWQEQALAQMDRWTFENPIVDIQQDNLLSTLVYSFDTILHKSQINYNTHQLELFELPVDFDKIRHTPFRNAFFGKEFLRDVFLSDRELSIRKAPKADNFEVDFFEGRIYIQANDSLYLYQISTEKTSAIGQLQEKILKAHYFQAPIEK